MNILLYLLPSGIRGTDRTHIFEVANNLSEMGHSIRYANGEMFSPVPVTELGFKTEDDRQLSKWGRIKKFLIASSIKGEALIIWLSLQEIRLFLSALVTVLRNRPDIIYRRHAGFFNGAYLIGELFHIPSVKEVNGISADELKTGRRADKIALWIIKNIERLDMRMADKIIVVTSRMKEILQRVFKVSGDKIVVITNGANTDLFKPTDTAQAKRELDLNQATHYICFAGSLARWQGVESMINSLPLVLNQISDKAQFLIVGDGGMRDELKALAERVGVTKEVVFTGMVPYHRVPLYINASDVCISLKTGLEFGFSPLKLCEYLACGKPVVASRESGFEILEDSGSGILVDSKDNAAVAGAIVKLLRNPELRKQMGDNGQRYVMEYQSWKSVAERVAGVFQGLINGRNDGHA